MSTIIDELVIALGLDAYKVNEGINKVGNVLGAVNEVVKDFGHGLADGFSGVESQSVQTSAALSEVKDNAHEAGQELQKMGATGAAATAKVESGARKAGRQVGFLGRQVSDAAKLITRLGKAAITGFAAGLAAPLAGALALNAVVKDYTEGLKRLEELNKKRNLSLKERQERQNLLNKYTEKDIKLYRETAKTFDEVKGVLDGLGQEIMRLLLPVFAALARGLKSAVEWVKENKQHWPALIPILTALAAVILYKAVPAFLSFTAAILSNPITWLVLALAALGVLIEDLIVWCRGGESAFGGLWDTIAKGGDIIYDAVQAVKGFFREWGRLFLTFQPISSSSIISIYFFI